MSSFSFVRRFAGLVIFGAVSAVPSVNAQRTAQAPAWPTVTQEMRPWTRWWWLGSAVNKTDLTANLEDYRRAGLGGVELTPIYGIHGAEQEHIPYLSAKWMEMLSHTIAEARRIGLGVDMSNGTGWPFGGPTVGDEDAAKYVAKKTYTLSAGKRISDTIAFMQVPLVRGVTGQVALTSLRDPIASTPGLAALAVDQVRFPRLLPLQTLMAYSSTGSVVDLTAKVNPAGMLDWTAPAGEWTLYAVFQGWHGKQVERAAPGGEGNALDHFSSLTITHYLSRFDSAFAHGGAKGIRAFFSDSYEVDDASGQGDWTPRMFDEFKRRRGYDLRTQLPALFDGGSSDTARRVISDYRETVSDLMLDGFTKTWAKWAGARNAVIRNQAHGSPANILDLYAASGIPETEGTQLTRIKFGTSAAHVTGKRLASSESATWLGEHFLSRLSDVRSVIDTYFLGGVNHIFYHGTAYSPASEPWPGRLFYAAVEFNPRNSWWRDFGELNSYIARVQSFMQSGAPDNDVLLYFPAYDRFAEAPRSNRAQSRPLLEHFDAIPPTDSSAFRFAADTMLSRGYAYDYISDRQLAGVHASGKMVRTGTSQYQTILVPATHFMPVETFAQLLTLARGGATLAFYGGLPADVPGLAKLEKRRGELHALGQSLVFSPVAANGAVQRAVIGNGVAFMSSDLNALLSAAGTRRETATDSGLKVIRRRERDGTTYFMVNAGSKPIDGWMPLAATGKSAAVYAPMHAASGIGRTRSTSNGMDVYLQIPAGAARIVRTYDAVRTGAPWQYSESAGTATPLTGSWTLAFLTGGPTLPAQLPAVSLGSWTDLPGEEVKNFSGTARYTTNFARPATNVAATAWRLDLGSVHESARVVLNGKELGTFIGPWFRVDIPAGDLRETNTLDVEVSNLMANRIADLDRRGVVWKKFYNTNFPARIGANRGADGMFSAAKWTPLPSGLAGPVTLMPMREKQF